MSSYLQCFSAWRTKISCTVTDRSEGSLQIRSKQPKDDNSKFDLDTFQDVKENGCSAWSFMYRSASSAHTVPLRDSWSQGGEKALMHIRGWLHYMWNVKFTQSLTGCLDGLSVGCNNGLHISSACLSYLGAAPFLTGDGVEKPKTCKVTTTTTTATAVQ